jgi:lambda family phage tail tape measure protein
VARLSAEMYDQQQALEAANKAQETRNRLLEEGKRVTEGHFTALQAYEAEVAKLDQLLAEGAINAATHALAVQQAEERKLKASHDWRDGAVRALKDYVDAATDAARNAEQVMASVLKGSEDTFVRWATTGKLQARDLFNSVAEEALRAAYRMAVVRPLSGIFESAIGGFFGSAAAPTPAPTAHTGGVIGTDSLRTRTVDPAVFANAPRFHGGGVVGNEVPIIAQRGEVVFTPGQMAALGGAMTASPQVNVAVNIENRAAKAEVRTETTRDSNGNLSLNVIIEEVENRLARNVGRGEGLAPTLERRYGLNPAAGSYR